MTATIAPQHEEFETEAGTSRRRKITKFALAGVAVLGIGAALTSAAWTDNVWFGGSASSSDFDLQGRGTAGEGDWEAVGIGNSTQVDIPATAFTNIGPNTPDTHTIEVRNASTIDVKIDSIAITGTGALFEAGAVATLGDVSDADRILGPMETAEIEIVVSGSSSWTNGQGVNSSGTVTVVVNGTSDLATAFDDTP